MLKIGSTDIDEIMFGSQEVEAVYFGTTKVWERVRASVLTSGYYDFMGAYDPEWGTNDWIYRRGFFSSALGTNPHGSLVPQELSEIICLGLYNVATQFWGDQGTFLYLSGNVAAGGKALVVDGVSYPLSTMSRTYYSSGPQRTEFMSWALSNVVGTWTNGSQHTIELTGA